MSENIVNGFVKWVLWWLPGNFALCRKDMRRKTQPQKTWLDQTSRVGSVGFRWRIPVPGNSNWFLASHAQPQVREVVVCWVQKLWSRVLNQLLISISVLLKNHSFLGRKWPPRPKNGSSGLKKPPETSQIRRAFSRLPKGKSTENHVAPNKREWAEHRYEVSNRPKWRHWVRGTKPI